MNTRRLVPLLLVGLGACGFPTLSYEEGDGSADGMTADGPSSDDGAPGDGSSGTEGGDGATGHDGSTTDSSMKDGAHDGPNPDEGGGGDSAMSTDSGHPVDASGDGAVNCDKDSDGHKAMGAPCNGDDCCDIDFNAKPGQTMFFPTADFCGSFDYNCNGKDDPGMAINITCGGTGLTGCSGGSAFQGNPACGTMGQFCTCMGSGALACTPQSCNSVTQSCN